MLRRIDKRGGVPNLVALATMTLLLVAILVGFVVINGIVKEVAGDRIGEKIYKEGKVGVGIVKEYMMDYNRLVNVEGRVRKGEGVESALEAEEPEFVSSFPTVPYIWGVFYG